MLGMLINRFRFYPKKKFSTTPGGASWPCAFYRRISRSLRPEILFASGMNWEAGLGVFT
jgi:hypothetical protein